MSIGDLFKGKENTQGAKDILCNILNNSIDYRYRYGNN